MLRVSSLLFLGASIGLPVVAQAYVGPGAGLTMLGSLWGLILAVLFVLFGILILPVKLMLNKRRKAREQAAEEATDEPELRESADEPNEPQG